MWALNPKSGGQVIQPRLDVKKLATKAGRLRILVYLVIYDSGQVSLERLLLS